MAQTNRAAFRATLGAAILLGLGILVLVNYVFSRRFARWDWTKSGLYSLSDKTKQVVKDLKAPVTVTVFMTEQMPLYREVDELLKRYRAASPLITVETLDPTRNIARAEALVKEFGIRSSTVVFTSGEGDAKRKKYVTQDQLAEYDFSRARFGGEPSIKAFKGEQEFTSAILAVTQSKTPRVLFTSGHGERSTTGRDRADLPSVAELLKRDNCTVEDWASLGAPDVPAGTDLLVVAGPRSAFTEPERAALRRWLDAGGRAIFLLDVEFFPGKVTTMADVGLKPLLEGIGVRLDDDVVVDPKNALPLFGPETVFARSFRPHAITKLLEGSAVVLPLARSVGLVEKMPEGWTGQVLIETSADGWGETDLANLEKKVDKDDRDVKGPVPLAVAVETSAPAAAPKEGAAPAKRSRVVVVGDADFASEGYVRNAANAILISAAANWALERDALVAIPPKATDQIAVFLSGGDLLRVLAIVAGVLPLAAIALGVAVWFRRRS